MKDAISKLRTYLSSVPAGRIPDASVVEGILASCWSELKGGDNGGMAAYKLQGRMEEVEWEPPVLTFRIERHGGTVMGSSRAELQYWDVDLDRLEASFTVGGHRQVRKMEPKLDVNPLADEIAALIRNQQPDPRLKWSGPEEVRVLVGTVIPPASLAKQTLIGRRKRLRQALDKRVNPAGWRQVRPNCFRRFAL